MDNSVNKESVSILAIAALVIAAVAAKYATDPGYAELVTLIANQTNVTRAIVAARREALGV